MDYNNTLRELAAEGVKRLIKAKADSPRLDTELLLAKAANRDRGFLHLNPDYRLNARMTAKYYALLEQRARGKPLQYLTGYREFMGLKFTVNPSVLIPRPDTETLVEEVLKELKGRRRIAGRPGAKDIDAVLLSDGGPRSADIKGNKVYKGGAKGPGSDGGVRLSRDSRVGATFMGLELGTGCGAIAVSLAYYFPGLLLKAVDISRNALQVARNNALAHGVAHRIEFIKGDLFSPLRGTNVKFDFIVSNPPYISAKEMKELPREVLYEPKEALYGGEDGLYFYKKIAARAPVFLKAGGFLAFEIGYDKADAVVGILKETDVFVNIKVVQDLARRDRVIIADMATGVRGVKNA